MEQKPNSRAYSRDVSRRKALRKRRLDKEVSWGCPFYDNLHQYSKNKIHCSCPMCSAKTNNKGKRRLKHGNYAPSKNWKHSDLQRQEQMDAEVLEYSQRVRQEQDLENWLKNLP